MRCGAFAKFARAILVLSFGPPHETVCPGGEMFTVKVSTQLFELSHRLRVLHIRKAAAQNNGNQEQVDELQAQIDALTSDCDHVLNADDAI